VQGGVLRADEYTGIAVSDEVPPECERLDSNAKFPPPCYAPDILHELREKEQAELASFHSQNLPERSQDLDRSLKLLKRCLKRTRKIQYHVKAASRWSLARMSRKLPYPIPDAWRSVLAVASGGYLPGDVYIISARDLPSNHARHQQAIEPGDPSYGQKLLHVASTSGGDWFSLVVEVRDSIDVPVLQIDHETDRVARRWESIASFLEEMVESDD